MNNCCGNCKHWYIWDEEKQNCCWVSKGDCDKIPKGCSWYDEKFKKHFDYDGYSFEDECYDDVFHCFEPKENVCKYCKANKCELMGGVAWNFGTDDCNGKVTTCAMFEQRGKGVSE